MPRATSSNSGGPGAKHSAVTRSPVPHSSVAFSRSCGIWLMCFLCVTTLLSVSASAAVCRCCRLAATTKAGSDGSCAATALMRPSSTAGHSGASDEAPPDAPATAVPPAITVLRAPAATPMPRGETCGDTSNISGGGRTVVVTMVGTTGGAGSSLRDFQPKERGDLGLLADEAGAAGDTTLPVAAEPPAPGATPGAFLPIVKPILAVAAGATPTMPVALIATRRAVGSGSEAAARRAMASMAWCAPSPLRNSIGSDWNCASAAICASRRTAELPSFIRAHSASRLERLPLAVPSAKAQAARTRGAASVWRAATASQAPALAATASNSALSRQAKPTAMAHQMRRRTSACLTKAATTEKRSPCTHSILRSPPAAQHCASTKQAMTRCESSEEPEASVCKKYSTVSLLASSGTALGSSATTLPHTSISGARRLRLPLLSSFSRYGKTPRFSARPTAHGPSSM